jgi:phytoene dehydrogenase-like protein
MTVLPTDQLDDQQMIVVGGGVAGLAAATYLARGGARVCLLEKASTLGGRASTDTLAGFALDRGAHALYTGGPASSVLAELGVAYSAGQPGRISARDERGLHPFPGTALGLLRTSLLDAADKAEMMGIFVRLGMLQASKLAAVSAADWVVEVARRPKVRQLLRSLARVYLYSAALDLGSAEVVVSRLQLNMKHPIHYLDGGWQTLVDALRERAAAAGVRILTSASAAEVQLRDSVATGVRLHDGTLLECAAVLLATTPTEAAELVPEFAAPYVHELASELTPVHIACMDLALRKLPEPSHPIIFDLERPFFVTAQSEFARLAPDGGAVVHAFRHLDPREAGDPRSERLELESYFDEVQPGWREVVVEQRFLPRMQASSALPLAARGGMGARARHRDPDVANVYFAGDWVGPRGYLVDASLDSARRSAQLMLQAPRSVQQRLAAAGAV